MGPCRDISDVWGGLLIYFFYFSSDIIDSPVFRIFSEFLWYSLDGKMMVQTMDLYLKASVERFVSIIALCLENKVSR